MPLWKIHVEGTTPMDVQGVNLRESIVSMANENGVCGTVRNRKGTRIVEVVCKCDSETARKFRDAISKIHQENRLVNPKRVTAGEPKRYEDPSLDEDAINSFEIEREDDLTEMVWALQNAGKALQLQEKLRVESLFRALRAETEVFQEVLSQIGSDSPYTECFPTVAIEGFLSSPPEGCKNLITKLYALYRYAKAINHMIRERKEKEEMPLEEVMKTLKEIGGILKG